VNPGFLTEAGLPADKVLGAHFLTLVDPVDRALAEREMSATLAGERRRLQLRCLGRTGSRLTLVTTAPLLEDGVVVGALGIVRDITNDEIRHEATLQQARLAAVGQSLGRVANELNNPLGSLLAVAELQLLSPLLGAEDRRAVEQIAEEARRASRIVGQLLDTTGEAPQHGATRAPVDVNAVLRRTLDHHGYTLRAIDTTVQTALAPGLRLVNGDALQLQQVFSNLLANAEQALSEHRGTREVRVTSAMHGDEVRVTIEDSGPGILPTHVERVLEPMFTTRGARGHRGLGLTITHTIVRDHGGQVHVHSAPGQGARFTLTFPSLAEGTSLTPPPAGRTPVGAAAISASPDGTLPASDAPVPPAASILLIEDEPTLRAAISRFLRGQHYDVQVADSGRAALDLVSAGRFDLILLDLRMKGISGEDVYDSMRATYPEQAQRVVFMTGDLHSAAASRFIRATGRPVLAKPFTLAELATRLEQLLEIRS
jgi:two-component system NtrC family sensor kinase